MNRRRRTFALFSSLMVLASQTIFAATEESDQDLSPPPAEETNEEQVVEPLPADSEPRADREGRGDEATAGGNASSGSPASPAPAHRAGTGEPAANRAGGAVKTDPNPAGRRDRRSTTRLEERARSAGRRERGAPEKDKAVHAPKSVASAGKREYAAFKLITDRNIFNASRSARTARSGDESRRSSAAATETLTLVGTLSSEKGAYAFFDGSKPEFRKVLEVGKTIADHKVIGITNAAVRLQVDTNAFDLAVGGQLRREDNGWHLVERSLPQASPKGGETSGDASSADENDIVKRLMQQRAKELQ